MTAPRNPLLEEAILSLANATTCRSCRRRQLHLSTYHSCQNILWHHDASVFYDGPLMVSASCGCLFCRDCYATASIIAIDSFHDSHVSDVEKNATTTSLTHKKKCPVCQNPCIGNPRPIIPWLANEYRSISLSIMCNSDVITSEIESHLVNLNSLFQVLSPQIHINEDVGKGTQFDQNWVGSESLEVDRCYSSRATPSNKILESPPHDQRENSKQKSLNDVSAIQFDESEVPGTCPLILQSHPASEVFSLADYRQTQKSDNETNSYFQVEASHDRTQRADSSLSSEPLKQIRSQIETKHSQRNGSQGIPGTLRDFHQTEEISFLERKRFSSDKYEPYNSAVQDLLMLCNHETSTLPACSEPYGQTEEVPETYLSFLDKRRISTVGNERNCSQMHHVEVYCSDSGAWPYSPKMNAYRNDGQKGLHNEAPVTSPSIHYNHSNTSSKLMKDKIQSDVTDTENPESDRLLPSIKPSQIDHCEDAYTEDVPGTIISFIDRSKVPNIEDALQGIHSFETRDRSILTKTKRRRVSASPQIKVLDDKKKPDGSGFDVPSNLDSMSNMYYSPTFPRTGTRRSYPASPITKRKGMIKKGACSTKTMRATTSNSDNLIASAVGEDDNTIAIQAKMNDKQLFIAYDILDPTEANALEWLNERGFCIVVNGVHRVPASQQNEFMPFPSILVTHSFDPGLRSYDNKKKTSLICLRSYQYVKAMALGARIIDAKWIIDSHHAGQWLDCNIYQIWSDSFTCETKGGTPPKAAKPQTLPLTGLCFGLTGYGGSVPSVGPGQGEAEPLVSQLQLQTKTMTSQQIKELLECWGGKCVLDSITDSHNAILVPTWKPLNCLVNDLRSSIKLIDGIKTWSVEKFHESSNAIDQLRRPRHIHRDRLLPLIRDKWLEDSICARSLLNLDKYCAGVLRLQCSTR